MKQQRFKYLIVILCVIIFLLLIGIGRIFWLYFSGNDAKPTLIQPTPEATDSTELAQYSDFQPDRSKLYTVYDAELTSTEGTTIRLSAYQGKPVVLFFWSSWCGDCKEYFKGDWTEAVQAANESGAEFLMVCRENVRGETAQTASDCLAEHKIDQDTYMDMYSMLFTRLGLPSVPSMAFLAPDGTLMHTTTELLDARGMSERIRYASSHAAEQTEMFIVQNLANESGDIASCYSFNELGDIIQQDVQLSETQGLIMEYALLKQDQTLFDQAFEFVQKELTIDGLCSWKIENGIVAQVNAALDDLRVISALLAAQELWGEYDTEIALRTRVFWYAMVKDDTLRDYYDFDQRLLSKESTLCYMDIDALDRLAKYQVKWQKVRDNAYELLQNGLISSDFPLYYPRYDSAQKCYTGKSLQMNEAMLTVLHAQRAGIDQEETLNFLEGMLRDGAVYASYLTDGTVAPGFDYESTATYALLVQIGVASGRDELTRMALERMEVMRSFEESLLGGYGMVTDSLHYTFDDLQALLAWSCL